MSDSSASADSAVSPSTPSGEGSPGSEYDIDPQRLVVSAARLAGGSYGPVHCGLTVWVSATRVPETIAATDDTPVRVDWLQNELQQGPAFVPNLNRVLVVDDFAAYDQCPEFGRLAITVLGLRSMVSVPVPIRGPNRAALSLYSALPAAFDPSLGPSLTLLSRPVAGAVGKACGQLRSAGDFPHRSTRLAGAMGMVMARYRMGAAPAFDLILEASRLLGVDVLTLATEVIRDGCLPDKAIAQARRRENSAHGR